MNEPVRPPSRVAHRFVPTLTEVVRPHPVPAPEAPALTQEFLEVIVDAALQRAEASLSQQLPEVLSVVLHEQALALSERLRREIRTVVRQSVAQALAEMLPDARVLRKKTPDSGDEQTEIGQATR